MPIAMFGSQFPPILPAPAHRAIRRRRLSAPLPESALSSGLLSLLARIPDTARALQLPGFEVCRLDGAIGVICSGIRLILFSSS